MSSRPIPITADGRVRQFGAHYRIPRDRPDEIVLITTVDTGPRSVIGRPLHVTFTPETLRSILESYIAVHGKIGKVGQS